MLSEEQHAHWERRQAELWDRIFQVTQDVITLADSMESSTGETVVKTEMVRTAMAVGTELVRANASEEASVFQKHLQEAKMKAIETDYWLRLAYILQQREDVQRDLSSIITQYSAIVDLLQKFVRHTQHEKNVIARHTRGPRIS
jgi:four helix bundle protein